MEKPWCPRILVVDDEWTIREMLSEFLLLNQYNCVVAGNGAEALAYVAEDPFDLVLLDVKMPEMSGIEVLRRINELAPVPPVIMVTAVSEVQTAVEAMQLGALDYIQKPFALKELLAKMEKALAKGASRREEQVKQEHLASEVQDQEWKLEQRAREIQALNRLFQEHIMTDNHVADNRYLG